jgi:hypothetical protein
MMESISTQSPNNSYDFEEIQIIINTNSNEEPNITNNYLIYLCKYKFITCLISTIFLIIILLDLYIAFSEHGCINEYMKIYLIISSIYILFLLIVYIFNKNIIKLIIFYRHITQYIIYIYVFTIIGYILCTILGSIIFWNDIDRSKCTYLIDTYLYITLVIKIISIIYLFLNKFFIT